MVSCLVAVSCVPMKKYKDVVEKAKVCEEELIAYKEKAIHFENKSNDLETSYHLIKEEVEKIKKDTALRLKVLNILSGSSHPSRHMVRL